MIRVCESNNVESNVEPELAEQTINTGDSDNSHLPGNQNGRMIRLTTGPEKVAT